MKKETFEKAKKLQRKITELEEALVQIKEEKNIYLCKWFDSRFLGVLKFEDEDLQPIIEMIDNMLKKAKEEFEAL